ncbi:MAG: response regulator [Rhodobiaceae bacterium]|nr:response regulator [Rhodobiaceae bacterium]
MKIHVIEDDKAVADSLRLLLVQMGYEVAVYHDGRSFRAAPLATGDRVILDLKLPDVSGAELLDECENRGAPVIVMTGQSLSAIKREIPDFDPGRIIRKPVSPEDLAAVL